MCPLLIPDPLVAPFLTFPSSTAPCKGIGLSGAALKGGSPASRLCPAALLTRLLQCVAQEKPPGSPSLKGQPQIIP